MLLSKRSEHHFMPSLKSTLESGRLWRIYRVRLIFYQNRALKLCRIGSYRQIFAISIIANSEMQRYIERQARCTKTYLHALISISKTVHSIQRHFIIKNFRVEALAWIFHFVSLIIYVYTYDGWNIATRFKIRIYFNNSAIFPI